MPNTKIALKGFANLKAHLLAANTLTAYTAGDTPLVLIGAQKCERDDNSTDYTVRSDDDIYDTGSEFEKTEVTITVVELALATLAALKGSAYSTTTKEMDETTLDNAPEFALSFSGLLVNGDYRLFRYYAAKLTKYKHSMSTKGQSNDPNAYELTFSCIGRKCDNKLRTTKDVAKPTTESNTLTWLDTVPAFPVVVGP